MAKPRNKRGPDEFSLLSSLEADGSGSADGISLDVTSLRPLAERMRPRFLDDMVGQRRLLAPGSALRRAVEAGRVHSMILWGPPGCGKTTSMAAMAPSST